MLREYEDALRAAAELVAGVDRDVRRKLVTVKGREERYTEKFVTLLEERLDGHKQDGVSWSVSTHVADKQSGQETRTGADLFVSIELDLEGLEPVRKGFQAQAKVNKNKFKGIGVDDKSRLSKQCDEMIDRSEASYVFAFGETETKIVSARKARVALPGGKLSSLTTDNTYEFFYDFFDCKVGDPKLFASSNRALQSLAEELEYKAAARVVAKGRARRD